MKRNEITRQLMRLRNIKRDLERQSVSNLRSYLNDEITAKEYLEMYNSLTKAQEENIKETMDLERLLQ